MAESDDATTRLTNLETRVQELEAMQDLILRLMSATRPLAGVLEHFGATETQEQSLYRLLDTLTERAAGPERDRPSFAHFEMRVCEIFPTLRGDRGFIQLLIDTLKVERPAYRKLHEYMVEQNWPAGH